MSPPPGCGPAPPMNRPTVYALLSVAMALVAVAMAVLALAFSLR